MTQPLNALPKAERYRARYGPWAVVTGASDGIGRAAAQQLAATGLNVVLVARRQTRLDDLARQLEKLGVETETVAVDLSVRDGVARLMDETAGLDVGLLVAAAGFGTSGSFLESDIDRERAMIDVNCVAVAELAHGFGGRLVARGQGGLLLFSSLVGFQGVPQAANYAATKAYVQTLAEGLRSELADVGVDLVTAAPGPVASGFGEAADMRMGAATTPEVVAAGALQAIGGRRTTVRPGARSKVLGWSLATAPRAIRTRILANIMGQFTAHQRA